MLSVHRILDCNESSDNWCRPSEKLNFGVAALNIYSLSGWFSACHI